MAMLRTEHELQDGDEIVFSKKSKKESTPTFSCIGGNMNYQNNQNYPELFDVLSKLSKAATWMFWELMKVRDSSTNISILVGGEPARRKQISKAYKELHGLGIIKRMKQNHYITNPKVMLPDRGFYHSVSIEYNKH